MYSYVPYWNKYNSVMKLYLRHHLFRKKLSLSFIVPPLKLRNSITLQWIQIFCLWQILQISVITNYLGFLEEYQWEKLTLKLCKIAKSERNHKYFWLGSFARPPKQPAFELQIWTIFLFPTVKWCGKKNFKVNFVLIFINIVPSTVWFYSYS